MISVFDMFKIGIGPSSSHTVGPMKAGKQFIDDLIEHHLLEKVTHIQVDVYGSLSMTGFGHSTDKPATYLITWILKAFPVLLPR